jgi:hypothetical protein
VDTETLYVSTWLIKPAQLFRVVRKDGVWGEPEAVFRTTSAIVGMVFTGPRDGYYVGGGDVYRLTDLKNAVPVLAVPEAQRLQHVTLVPEPVREKLAAEVRSAATPR